MTGVVPPSPFPQINTHLLKAGTVLHRTHLKAYAPTEFNPCRGQISRFAPFLDLSGKCVPTLYAAMSREAAVFESIFHDIEATAAFKVVRLENATSRFVSTIATKRDLVLAGLFAPDLQNWNIGRHQIIDTPKSTYPRTALWAAAIYAAAPQVAGLIWTSRRCDPDRCIVLFGDRVGEADLEMLERRDPAVDPDLLLELRGFGLRAGIALVS